MAKEMNTLLRRSDRKMILEGLRSAPSESAQTDTHELASQEKALSQLLARTQLLH
jgi:hypothetical protein